MEKNDKYFDYGHGVLKNKLNDIEHTINDVLLEYERAIYRKL